MDPVRIDLGVRIVATVQDYRMAGTMMDDLHDAIEATLHIGRPPTEDHPWSYDARFDFVNFQTRPCKANQMAVVAAGDLELTDGGMPGGPF